MTTLLLATTALAGFLQGPVMFRAEYLPPPAAMSEVEYDFSSISDGPGGLLWFPGGGSAVAYLNGRRLQVPPALASPSTFALRGCLVRVPDSQRPGVHVWNAETRLGRFVPDVLAPFQPRNILDRDGRVVGSLNDAPALEGKRLKLPANHQAGYAISAANGRAYAGGSVIVKGRSRDQVKLRWRSASHEPEVAPLSGLSRHELVSLNSKGDVLLFFRDPNGSKAAVWKGAKLLWIKPPEFIKPDRRTAGPPHHSQNDVYGNLITDEGFVIGNVGENPDDGSELWLFDGKRSYWIEDVIEGRGYRVAKKNGASVAWNGRDLILWLEASQNSGRVTGWHRLRRIP